MSHTNSTANYNLPQFVGSDKPAWLTDINTAFSGIDTQMKTNNTLAGTADGKADTNASAIGTLSNLATEAKSNLVSAVNEVNGKAGQASTTASQASALASQVSSDLEDLLEYIDLKNYAGPINASITGATLQYSSLFCATNDAGTLAKFYGVARISGSSGGTVRLVWQTAMRPTEEITIAGGCLVNYSPSNASQYTTMADYTIATDGKVTLEISVGQGLGARINFVNSLLFVKNFGDTPTPQA